MFLYFFTITLIILVSFYGSFLKIWGQLVQETFKNVSSVAINCLLSSLQHVETNLTQHQLMFGIL
jgi:hypothetical protein